MNATLERLVALKAEATNTRAQIDYLDQILTDAVVICRRPGDVERCATFLDELVAEIATTRGAIRPAPTPERPQEPAGDDFNPQTGPAYPGTPIRVAGAQQANPPRHPGTHDPTQTMTDAQTRELLRIWAMRSFGTTSDETSLTYGVELLQGRNPTVRQD